MLLIIKIKTCCFVPAFLKGSSSTTPSTNCWWRDTLIRTWPLTSTTLWDVWWDWRWCSVSLWFIQYLIVLMTWNAKWIKGQQLHYIYIFSVMISSVVIALNVWDMMPLGDREMSAKKCLQFFFTQWISYRIWQETLSVIYLKKWKLICKTAYVCQVS